MKWLVVDFAKSEVGSVICQKINFGFFFCPVILPSGILDKRISMTHSQQYDFFPVFVKPNLTHFEGSSALRPFRQIVMIQKVIAIGRTAFNKILHWMNCLILQGISISILSNFVASRFLEFFFFAKLFVKRRN